jgi:hypothetical protein
MNFSKDVYPFLVYGFLYIADPEMVLQRVHSTIGVTDQDQPSQSLNQNISLEDTIQTAGKVVEIIKKRPNPSYSL